jgi:ATP-dependent exoDNAse (exonuclease V) beta subunit
MSTTTEIKTISYSGLKIWNECPFKYKLSYVDKISGFQGNEYTAFGTALHEACEFQLNGTLLTEGSADHFSKRFEEEISGLPSELTKDEKLIGEMREQGRMLAPLVIPALKEKFGNFKFFSAEEELTMDIDKFKDCEFKFRGYIDLIIQDENGVYTIIDFKTCAWGWDAQKKSDAMINYQLTFYKYFFGKKHNVDAKEIETYFALLKRTAKKDNVEIFRVTSGPRKTNNAFNLLEKALYSIGKSNFPKNRLNCKYCEYYKKECK